ncbi:MAG: hypothetical protein J6B89_02705 [Bacilli bacterium]|nr:hypothetical protein [Bacilli bacterium]
MKKSISLIALTILILSLSGCEKSKTLICTKNLNSQGATIENTNTVKFKDKKLKNMVLEYNYTLDEEYIKNATSIKESIDKQFSEYTQYNGIKYSSQLNDKQDKISYKIEIDINKISNEAKEKLNISGDESYEANKKSLEEVGYICR